MATTVNIIIKGIAIAYRKNAGNWHILFPIDRAGCHKINFTYKQDDNSETDPVPLADLNANPANPVTITTNANSATGQTNNFRDHVFDLTKAGIHPGIRLKTSLLGPFVLMTMQNAKLSIYNYLQDYSNFPPNPPYLYELDAQERIVNSTPIDLTAHSAAATYTLVDGQNLTVAGGRIQTPFVFNGSSSTDTTYTLIFDNDCNSIRVGINDMYMFYEVIEEDPNATGYRQGRHFRIGDTGVALTDVFKSKLEQLARLSLDQDTIEKLLKSKLDEESVKRLTESVFDETFIEQILMKSEPPNFLMGKPCLFVKASDPNDLP